MTLLIFLDIPEQKTWELERDLESSRDRVSALTRESEARQKEIEEAKNAQGSSSAKCTTLEESNSR